MNRYKLGIARKSLRESSKREYLEPMEGRWFICDDLWWTSTCGSSCFPVCALYTTQWVARFTAYQCKWHKGASRLILLLGMEAINRCIFHDKEIINSGGFATFSKLVLVHFLLDCLLRLFSFGLGTGIWYPRVALWVINRCEMRERSEHALYICGKLDLPLLGT